MRIELSLKTRMALAVSILFVLFAAALAVGTLAYFRREFKQTISGQQFAIVSSIAADIDHNLETAHNALVASAASLPPDLTEDADAAQQYLNGKSSLRSIFDNAIFLFSRDGRLIAESPFLPGRRGKDFSYRDYYRQTMATGKPHISSVYPSTHANGHPAIMLTAPVFDRNGRVVAILAGSFDITGKNFLVDLTRTRIGRTGYLYIIHRNRTIIAHPDQSRIMKQDVPAGANRLLDKALAGFEGTGETVTSRGLHALTSFRHLRSTDWIVGANYPLEEAYAPLHQATHYYTAAIAAGMAAVLAIAWLLMKRLTASLLAFTRHVEGLPDKAGGDKFLDITSRDEIGTLAAAFNTMIGELDRQHATLQEREVRFRLLAENAQDMIFRYRFLPQPAFDYINPAATTVTGYGPEEFYGEPALFIRIIHPDDRNIYDILQHNGISFELPLTIRWVRKDGRTVWTEQRNVPTYGSDGRIMAIEGIVRDVSARRQAAEIMKSINVQLEQRVRERTFELEASNRELESFCYSVSHDLRTPLRGINGFSSLLLEEYGASLDESGREYLRRISAAAGQMGRLIDDLLDLSRMSREELHRSTVLLSGLAREIAGELQRNEPQRQAEIVITDGITVEGDAQFLRLVLQNLLENAWKFTAASPSARIEFGVCGQNGDTVFFVRDNGAGFDMRYLNKLFQPFQRLHHANEFPGTGIGLATVERIIARHGGRVWAEGEVGKGAAFYFTLG